MTSRWTKELRLHLKPRLLFFHTKDSFITIHSIDTLTGLVLIVSPPLCSTELTISRRFLSPHHTLGFISYCNIIYYHCEAQQARRWVFARGHGQDGFYFISWRFIHSGYHHMGYTTVQVRGTFHFYKGLQTRDTRNYTIPPFFYFIEFYLPYSGSISIIFICSRISGERGENTFPGFLLRRMKLSSLSDHINVFHRNATVPILRPHSPVCSLLFFPPYTQR